MKTIRIGILSLLLLLAGLGGKHLSAQNLGPLPKFNILSDANLVLEPQKLNNYDYKFTLRDKTLPSDKSIEFIVMPLSEETFVNALIGALKSLSISSGISDTTKDLIEDDVHLKQEARTVFLIVQSAGITADLGEQGPKAGTLVLNSEIDIQQFLRVNNKALQEKIDEYSIVKIRRDKKFSEGKMLSATETFVPQKDSKANTDEDVDDCKPLTPKYGNHCVVCFQKCRPKVHNFVASKKCVVLVSKSDEAVFETFRKKYEAVNRRRYLASRDLLKQMEDSISAERSIKEKYTNALDQKNRDLKQSEDSLHQLDSVKKSDGLILKEIESLGEAKATHSKKIAELAYELGYKFEKDELVPFGQPKSRPRLLLDKTLSIDQAQDSYIGIIPRLNYQIELKKDDITALTKLVKSRKEDVLNDEEKNTLNSLYPIEELPVVPGAKTVLQILKSLPMSQLKGLLVWEEYQLTHLNKQTETVEALVDLLKAYSRVKDTIDAKKKAKDELWEGQKLKESEFDKNRDSLLNRIKSHKASIKDWSIKISQSDKKIADEISRSPLRKFKVEYATFEFNQGYIENIVVFGQMTVTGEKVKFTNVQPIGFSRKRDFDNLKNFDLWTEPASNGTRAQYSMNLEDLIANYLQNLALNRRDYSPKDQTIEIYPQKDISTVLYKDNSYQLIEAKVFSDFVGMDPTAPNGLIQTEVGKRINLITQRTGLAIDIRGGMRGNAKKYRYRSKGYFNWGLFGYIHPLLTLSKIENNNRVLQLQSRDTIINNQYFQERYASTLDLRNYEYLSVGFDLNLGTLDLPFFKSTFYFDGGFRFGRTQVVDSIRSIVDGVPQNTGKFSDFGVNTFRWYPKFTWEIKPEERYGLEMSILWNHYYLWNGDVRQVADSKRFAVLGENDRPYRYRTLAFQAYFNPNAENPTGKLFFRYTFNNLGWKNWTSPRWSTNFHQAQLGYSFFLMGANKSRKQD